MVGIVDTAIVGHLSDAAAIGGIAIGTMLFDLLYWNFGFLRVGTSGLTAQAYGKGQRDDVRCTKVPEECRKILTQGLTIAVMAAGAILAIQSLFVTAVLAVVPCSEETADIARTYFYARVWAAPATLMLFTFKGWFIGMQDTKSPMAVDIVVNVVNMAASYYLAVCTSMGVLGVAYGTVFAQCTGLLLAILIMVFKYRIVHIGLMEILAAMKWQEIKQMTALNGNLFIRSLCFMVVYVGYTSLASQYGDTELAVSSILMKLFMFFSYFVDGFAYAGEALVGKAFGENLSPICSTGCHRQSDRAELFTRSREGDKLNVVVRALFKWSIGVGLVFSAVYAVWGEECMALMTNNADVLEAVQPYIGWLIAMPIVSALAFMWDGVFVGATAGKQIRNAMIWAAVGFVVLYVTTYRFAGAQALYIAYFAHLAARVVYLTIAWKDVKLSNE